MITVMFLLVLLPFTICSVSSYPASPRFLHLFLNLLVPYTISSVSSSPASPRFLHLFTRIRFPNTECPASSGDNGTCYTAAECTEYSGRALGTCASGFGVCCVLQHSCGGQTAKNSTYFVNAGFPSSFNSIGQCSMTIDKLPDCQICQIRLDFVVMDIQQPDLISHQCTQDRFLVTGGSPIPIICGVNSGSHMYIEAISANSPTSLTFITTGDYDRAFKVKIGQIECGAVFRAVEGCLQQHNAVSGVIQSFNYNKAEGLHLSNQEYSICIRNHRGFCGISYTACMDPLHDIPESFTLHGQDLMQPGTPGKVQVGDTACTTDWITIPCATTSTAGSGQQSPGSTPHTCIDRLCGEVFCSVTDHPSPSTPCPVYSHVRPFTIRVHFDQDEAGDGGDSGAGRLFEAPITTADNRGFCLNYVQQPCTS